MDVVIGVLLLASVFPGGNALTCFICDQIAFPRDCPTVVKCGEHEECFTDKIITDDGNIYYNTGCRDKQKCIPVGRRSLTIADRQERRQGSFETTICSQCCDVDHCNYGGCGAPALPPADQRGPICYACDMMRDPSLCNKVTLCSRDDLCEVLKTPHPTFDVTYTAKCGTKTVCDRLMAISHGFGRRDASSNTEMHKRASLCFRCCKGDLCNLGCEDQNVTTTVSTATTTVLTTQATTLPSSTASSITTDISTTTTGTSATTTGISATTTGTSATTPYASSMATVLSTSATVQTTDTTTTLTTSAQLSSTLGTNASNHGCLPEYIFYGKSCYYFSKSSLYWEPSRKFCKDHGSDLIIINDATENNLIIQHLKQLEAQHLLPTDLWGFYIGAHLVNGTWKWVDNTDLTYHDWAPKEPDNPDSHVFGAIYVPSSGYYNYQWASHKDMYTTMYFICEFNPNP